MSSMVSLLLGLCYSNSFIILEPKIKMDNYSSVRNKLAFSYNMLGGFTRKNLFLPSEESSLIHVWKICTAQVQKLKLCMCSGSCCQRSCMPAWWEEMAASLLTNMVCSFRNCDCDRQMSLCCERRGKKLLIIYCSRNPNSGHCGSSEKFRTKTAL